MPPDASVDPVPPAGADSPSATSEAPGATETSPAPASEPQATSSAAAEPSTSPLEDAFARLTGDKPKAAEPEKPPAPADKKAAPPPAVDKGTTEKKSDIPADPAKPFDPFDGFTKEQRDALKGQTRARIEELGKKVRAAQEEATRFKTEIEPLKAASERVKLWDDIIAKNKLAEDLPDLRDVDVAQGMQVQAAINRTVVALNNGTRPSEADVQRLAHMHATMMEVGKALGFAPAAGPAPAEPPAPAPAPAQKADLPDDLRDAVAYNILSEEEARHVAELRSPKAAQPPKAEPAPVAPPKPVAPAVQPVSPQPPAPVNEAEDNAYFNLTVQELQSAGTKDPVTYINSTLAPVIRSLIGETANFFNLSPRAKHDVVMAAHRITKGQEKPAEPAQPHPKPIRSVRTPVGQRAAAATPSVDDAINFLASE